VTVRSRLPRRRAGDRAEPAGGSARWTTIGNVGSALRALVDPAGLVTPAGAGWSLDWSIGAGDRWHRPAAEVAVRQRLVGAAPVVETAMRIPGGDAVHRAWAARSAGPGGGHEVVVVEVENRSPVPVAVGFAVRGAGTVALDGATVSVDGRPRVLLPRPPSSLDAAPGELVHPLPHTATIRVAVPLAPARRSRGPDPAVRLASLPPADRVAAGWHAHTARGMRVDVPDERLAEAVDANRSYLLLFAGDASPAEAGLLAPTLDRYGFHGEAAAVLLAAGRDVDLAAAAEHWRLTGDRSFAGDLAPLVAERCRRAARAGDAAGRRRLLLDGAELLGAAGQPEAAADAERAAAAGPVDPSARPAPGHGRPAPDLVAEALAAASLTWTWSPGHDRAAACSFLDSVRSLVLRATGTGLALCPAVPEAWAGRPVEVVDAPTPVGRVSFAVRWHGDRPALLWDVVPHQGRAPGPVTVTAPGLDRSWSSGEANGDALLSAAGVR
jgi:hypothetical protein